MPQSNDHFSLEPRTAFDGPALEFDFPGLSIGIAEYEAGPTGCTVFIFEGGWATSIDVRGGMVGITGSYEFNHGICLAGGSLMGLEAATGVAAELFARGGHSVNAQPLVSGAIIFDYFPRQNTIHPDRELGRAATKAAVPGRFPLGRRGAGRSASIGKLLTGAGESSGQGAAFRETGGAKILVCSVVNALGAAVGRGGATVRGNLDRASGRRFTALEALERAVARPESMVFPTTNTTLTVVATDAVLPQRALTQLGRQVHSSMARAIQPFHTPSDGDVLFCVTSNRTKATLPVDMLGIAASELAWDAVLSAVDV